MLKTSRQAWFFRFFASKMQDTAVNCRSLLLLIFDCSNEGLERKEMEGWNKLPKTKTDLVLFEYCNTKCFWNKPALIPTAYLLVSKLVHLRWAIITKSWNCFFKWNGCWWMFLPFPSLFLKVYLFAICFPLVILANLDCLSSTQFQDHTGTNQ